MKLTDESQVIVFHQPYTQVIDKDANRLWAVAVGLERMLRLPWQTLNSHTKELLTIGAAPPDGTSIWSKATIQLRRGPNAKGAVKESDDTILDDIQDGDEDYHDRRGPQ